MQCTIREICVPETALAHPALSALRPRFTDPAKFIRQIDEHQRPDGYRLVGVFVATAQADTPAEAAAGFRLSHNLAWGRFLYVDDLSTVPTARRRGHGRRLLDWLIAEAEHLGCDTIHLDSGVGADRLDAHRLYLNARMRITSYHFARSVAGDA